MTVTSTIATSWCVADGPPKLTPPRAVASVMVDELAKANHGGTRMGKKSFIGGLTAALVFTAASIAQAAPTKTKHAFTITAISATVSSTGRVPSPGSSSIQAGTLRSSLFGNGAGVTKTSFATGSSSTTFTFSGTTTFFTPNGSFKATVSGTGSVAPGPTTTITSKGSAKITGGTGRYAGATGKYTLTATTQPNAPLNVTLKGTITY